MMARQFRVIPGASAKLDPNAAVADVIFVDAKGKPTDIGGSAAAPYVLPAAAENALGGVKLANVASAGNANAAVGVAAGDAPTKAEHDALVAAYNDLAKRVNALVAGLVAAGVVKTS
ncbi:hypothetical protein BIFADO_01404 [Bifidobacterium adolescentis L2-32]|uniref:Head fiber protein n=2 Tax=Bifidobacterium adolescentis TaxID=1680 RepID=A7A6C4_BIFAD|nr:hypothetical protein BIFADO_01404 [Bifidobacterium adolescentis L2-32]